MAKKAFCVGINDYGDPNSNLNGCVNDARAWAELLVGHYDFPRADVTIITDAQATKANMVTGIKALLAEATAGDVLVFTNSSHGSYVYDQDGDETRYDEILCPRDVGQNPLADDELRALFSAIPAGVRLTVIADNCHSGSATRASPFPTPDERRVRFLNPRRFGGKELPDTQFARPKRLERYPESEMKEILLSGCTDSEYSYDALLDGTYHGAMTFFALQTIRAANYRLTYEQLARRVNGRLRRGGYNQHPQLEGADQNKARPIFT